MENNVKEKNNSKGVIVLLCIIIVVLLALCALFATGTISLNNKQTSNEQTTTKTVKLKPTIRKYDSDKKNETSNEESQNKQWIVYQQCGGIIYYNPITNKGCNKDENDCHGWYVISKDKSSDSQIDIILNKNLGTTVALNENGNPDEGPITALNYLKSQTENWKVSARLLTIDDVASILNVEKNEDGNIGVLEVPKCLYSNGDSREYWDGGYWLADYEKEKPVFVIDCSRGLISAGNQFIKSSPTNSTTWGVRPVITIDKSVLEINN